MNNDTLEALKKLMDLGAGIGELKAELAAVKSERDWLRKRVEELDPRAAATASQCAPQQGAMPADNSRKDPAIL